MKSIGGYFELADREQGEFIHSHGTLLNTGRNALEWILLSLGSVRKVYLPYYTCDVVLEPLRRLSIPWEFYQINSKLEIDEELSPSADEYVIINNYFGVKDRYIQEIVTHYEGQVIVDCAQAFFAPVIPDVKMFYSPRKFVGVADGGIAYGVVGNTDNLVEYDSSKNSQHLIIRKEQGAEAGFPKYREDEEMLDNQQPQIMSAYTRDILVHINYQAIIKRRRENYSIIETELSQYNLLKLPSSSSFSAPMAYPLMVENGIELRNKLIENKIFVPKFWPNECIPDAYCANLVLSQNILPLPIDQRYGEEEMNRIIEIIKR